MAEPILHKCRIVVDAEEIRDDDDCGGNWTRRPRYDVSKVVLLPFVPRRKIQLVNVLGPGEHRLCWHTDPDTEDDDYFGWEITETVWDCASQEFIIRLGFTIMLPWESTPDTLARLYPGWEFVLNKDRSKGFCRNPEEN